MRLKSAILDRNAQPDMRRRRPPRVTAAHYRASTSCAWSAPGTLPVGPSIVSKTRRRTPRGISLWNRSLIEFTKTRRGRRHPAAAQLVGLSVRSKPFSNGWSARRGNVGEALGIAVVAAAADLGAAPDGVPRRVGPLDRGLGGHASTVYMNSQIVNACLSCQAAISRPPLRVLFGIRRRSRISNDGRIPAPSIWGRRER